MRKVLFGIGVLEFVCRIEGWDRNINQFQCAQSPMPRSGRDIDGSVRADREALSVELNFAFAFDDDVDLGHPPMVMDTGFLRDRDQMDGGDGIWDVIEGASGGSTRAWDAGNGVQLSDSRIGHGWTLVKRRGGR
jgi:hypothetical protein